MAMLIAHLLAWLPGLIAERRNHRHPVMVTVCGFVGMWIHPVLWGVVLVWALKGETKTLPSTTP